MRTGSKRKVENCGDAREGGVVVLVVGKCGCLGRCGMSEREGEGRGKG